MSVGIWNAVEQKLEKIAGKVNLNDSSTSEEHTWSSKKISDSLVDIDADNVNITKEDDTKKSLQAMYEDGELGGGGGSDDYSTEEKVIGKWINGKPIYRKVMNISESIVISSSSWTSVFTADWVSTIEAIIRVGANLTNYQNNSFCLSFFAQKSGSTISLRSAVDIRANTVIFEYTKNTD